MKIHTLLLTAILSLTCALSTARAEGFTVPSINSTDAPEVMVTKLIEASRNYLAQNTCKSASGVDAECIDSRLKLFANEFKRQAWNRLEAPCPVHQTPLCPEGKILSSGGLDERSCPKAAICTGPVSSTTPIHTSCPMYQAPLCPPGQILGPSTTDANNCPKPGSCKVMSDSGVPVTAPSVPAFDRSAIQQRINEEIERTRTRLQERGYSPPHFAPSHFQGGSLYPDSSVSVPAPAVSAAEAEEHLRKFAPLTGPIPGQIMEGIRTGTVPSSVNKESIRAGITSLTTIPGRIGPGMSDRGY